MATCEFILQALKFESRAKAIEIVARAICRGKDIPADWLGWHAVMPQVASPHGVPITVDPRSIDKGGIWHAPQPIWEFYATEAEAVLAALEALHAS